MEIVIAKYFRMYKMWITYGFNQNIKNYPHGSKLKPIFTHRPLKLHTACEQPLNASKPEKIHALNIVDKKV